MIGLLVGLTVLVVAALLAMKLVPPYMEFFTVKKAVAAVAQDNPGGTVSDLRKAFERRTDIDAITSVAPADLEITKDSSGVVISFAYRKEVPLFANLGVYVDFQGSSRDR
jgi:hypothetical protein